MVFAMMMASGCITHFAKEICPVFNCVFASATGTDPVMAAIALLPVIAVIKFAAQDAIFADAFCVNKNPPTDTVIIDTTRKVASALVPFFRLPKNDRISI
jgi:hypothetical protein